MRLRSTLFASRYEFRLSGDRPFYAWCQSDPVPTPLQVSIHEGFEVGVLLAGSIEVRYDDYVRLGKPGDVWLIGMWEPHQWRVTSPNTRHVSVVFLPGFLGDELLRGGSWLNPFACPPSRRPLVATAETRQAAIAVGEEMRREIERKSADWETGIRLGLIRLLFALTRGWQAPARSDLRSWRQASGLARVMPALAAIHARPVNRVTIPEAAAACGLSPAQFNRVFRHVMGLSFAQLQLRSHLAFAAHLLLTTDTPVDGIAAQVGFTDRSHLHRHFVRHYTLTPNQFREQGG